MVTENITVAMRMLFDGGGFRQAQKAFKDLVETQKTGIGLTNKQIQGIARTKKEFAKLNASGRNMKDLSRQNAIALKDMFEGTLPGMIGFQKVAEMSTEEFKKWNENGKRGATVAGKAAGKFRMMTAGLKGFRMEMLGVMFFGMAMANMFKSMLAPATESLGITQLWTTMLQVLFLPIMLELLPVLLKFMTFFMELPEGVQLAIGAVAIFGLILGKLLFIIGTLTLGLGALWGTTLPATLAKLGTIAANIFAGITAAGAALFAVILAVVVGFVLAWKTNFGKIREWVSVIWVGIKNMFFGGLNWMIGFIKLFVGLATLNFDLIGEAFKQMWLGGLGVAKGVLQAIVGIVTTIGLTVLRVVVGLWNSVISLFNNIPGVNISTISTGRTAGLENQVRQASNVEVNQEVNITTEDNKESILDQIKRANEEWMREINRNGA